MKILHLSTYDTIGGAARAATRLHVGLGELGVTSSMLVRRKRTQLDTVHVAPPLNRWRWKLWRFIEDRCITRNRTGLSNTFFTLGQPAFDLSRHPLVVESDVLHLHWVGHFQSPASLASLAMLGKPMVWTLHDMRPFTGGCHFSAGCDEYMAACDKCPQLQRDPNALTHLNLAAQREALGGITIVAPSRWLADCARRSAVFRDCRVEVIPLGINTCEFSPTPQAEARAQLGLTQDRTYVLFGADGGGELRKGAAELRAAFQHLLAIHPTPEKLTLLCFGAMTEQFTALGEKTHALGYLKTTEQLRLAYAAADVFALPSLEDNLPNTMLESLACGTPVAGFDVGGIPDLVEPGVTGALARPGDPQSLAYALLEIIRDPTHARTLGQNGAHRIASHYTARAEAEAYRALYPTVQPTRGGKVRHHLPVSRLLWQALRAPKSAR